MKEPIRDPLVMSRMKMAFDLYETAEAILRQNLRRRFPGEDEASIEARIVAWLHRRPGAEHGDGAGRPSRRFESTE
jgi:hypothetical protein